MTTYYVDPVAGNDANDGLSWGTAYKTLLNGPTAARLGATAGDEIRIAKSPDPVSIGGATWTTASSTITVPGLTNVVIDQCESGWIAQLITPTYPSTYRQGAASIQFVAASTNGNWAYKTYTSVNLSAYTRLTFWVRFTNAANYTAGCPIRVIIGSGTSGTVTMNLPSMYYPPAYWVPITIDNVTGFSATANSISIQSTSAVTNTVMFDNFTVAKPASDSTSLVLTDLIAKDNGNGEYYPVLSIAWTAVAVGTTSASGVNASTTFTAVGVSSSAGNYFALSTETTATVKRQLFSTALIVPATATTTAINAITYTNAANYPATKAYIGGVNPATDVVDGETWFDGLTGYGYGITQTNSTEGSYTIDKLAAVRYYINWTVNEGYNVAITNASSVNPVNRSVQLTHASYSAPVYNSCIMSFNWIHSGTFNAGVIAYNSSVFGRPYALRPGSVHKFTVANAKITSTNNNIFAFGQVPVDFESTGTIIASTSNSAAFLTQNEMGAVFINNYFVISGQPSSPIFGSIPGSVSSPNMVYVTGKLGTVASGPNSNYLFYGGQDNNVVLQGIGPDAQFYVPIASALFVCDAVNTSTRGNVSINDMPISNPANLNISPTGLPYQGWGAIRFHNYNGVAGDHRIYHSMGKDGSNRMNYLQYQTTTTYSGNGAWQYIQAGDNNTFGTPHDIGRAVVKANQAVTVSMWVRRNSAIITPSLYVCGFRTSTNTTEISASGTDVNSWQQLSVTFTPLHDTIINIRAMVVMGAPAVVGANTCFFDDLQITQA